MPMIIANIYASIFSLSIQLWHLIYIQMFYWTLYVILSNIIFKNNMIKLPDNNFIITGYLLQQINIHRFWNNKQQYMLYHPNFNNAKINTCQKQRLPSFLLENSLYITSALNLIVCGNNIHNTIINFHKVNTVSRKKCQITSPAFMLASLVNFYSFGA